MNQSIFTLTIATHFFKITKYNDRIRQILFEFVRDFVKIDQNKGPRDAPPEMTVFCAATKNRSEFRFHINSLPDFKKLLERHGVPESVYTTQLMDLNISDSVDLVIKPHWVFRDDQLPILSYLEPSTPRSKFVGIQTGKGKTVTALKGAVTFGKRLLIIVRPMFMGKWAKDIKEILEIDIKKETMAIQGSAHLKAFIELAKTEGGLDNTKVIVMSNKTFQMWIKLYEEFGEETKEMGYGCTPDELCNIANIGMRLIDEVHMDFHLNFKIDLYTNVEQSISLSATLLNNDPFIERMYRLAYPLVARYQGGVWDRYALTYGVAYHLEDNRKVRTSEFGQSTYSHIAFEKSILKNPHFKDSYCKLIKEILDYGYIKGKVDGQRAVVFAASKDMCSVITGYLSKAYPTLTVNRYVEGDPYTNYLDSDIRVTTVLSGGTAHDVKNLTCAVLTIALKSIQANIQVLGRLRKIPDVNVKFFFLSCLDVPKHLGYHRDKEQIMREKAATYTLIPYNRRV